MKIGFPVTGELKKVKSMVISLRSKLSITFLLYVLVIPENHASWCCSIFGVNSSGGIWKSCSILAAGEDCRKKAISESKSRKQSVLGVNLKDGVCDQMNDCVPSSDCSHSLENGSSCPVPIHFMLVSLADFTINSNKDNELYFKWNTISEIDNLGMNIWCAQMQDNQFQEITKLNSELIPSKAIQPNYGTSYSSTDYPYVNTNLKPGVQHCALEDIDASGQCTLHCDQIDTTVVGKDQNVTDVNLNELNAKAIALCHQYEDSLTEAGQGGVCLDQLLISREPRLIPYRR